MTVYTCTHCCFYSIYEANYKRHLKTKKHVKMMQNMLMEDVTQDSEELDDAEFLEPVLCDCGRDFKHRSSLCRHKRVCKLSEYDDLSEMLDKKEEELKYLSKKIKSLENSIESDKMEIHKITKKGDGTTQHSIINNNSINNNINNNISLRNFDDPDITHLTQKNYKKALRTVMNCVPELVRMVHFNANKPENYSIYIPYINSSHVNIFKNGKWISTNMKPIINGIFDDHCYLLQQWVEEQGADIEEEIKRMFVRFERELAKEKNKKESCNILKELLYNGRDMVKKNKYLSTKE